MSRRRKNLNFGTVSIGESDNPTPVDNEKPNSISKTDSETKEKIRKYRELNPEKPKSTEPLIQTPLSIKRNVSSFDDEYVDLAKKYLGIPESVKPTVAMLSKKIVGLFEDNVKLVKKLNLLSKRSSYSISSSPSHSWEHGGCWN